MGKTLQHNAAGTISMDASKNGCYNRKPLVNGYWVHDGFFDVAIGDVLTRCPKVAWIAFRMATECQYSKDDRYNDPKCLGCKHKKAPMKGL